MTDGEVTRAVGVDVDKIMLKDGVVVDERVIFNA